MNSSAVDVARPRSFDESTVLDAAAGAFLRGGYEGTSVDDLVKATGVHRGSLYGAFGSKRGVFLATLRRDLATALPALLAAASSAADGTARLADRAELDLLLIAALERGPTDADVAGLVREALERIAEALGRDPATAGTATDPVLALLGARLVRRLAAGAATDAPHATPPSPTPTP